MNRAWLTLALMSALFFVITAATFTSLGLALPAMSQELHWSWSEAGIGYSLLAVCCGLTSYAPAALIRRVGVRANFLIGAAVMAAGFACLAYADGLGLYLAGAALAGLGFTLLATVPGTYLLTRLFERPGFAFGLYFTVGGLGGVAGPQLYQWIAGPDQAWREFWIIAGLATVLASVVAALFCDTASDVARSGERDPDISTSHWTVAQVLRSPQFVLIAAAYAGFLICDVSTNYASTPHLMQQGIAADTSADLLSAFAFLNAVSRLAGGLLTGFARPHTLLATALAFLAMGMTALAFGHGQVALLVYVVGIGIGSGMTFFASTILLLDYFGRKPNLELFSIVNLISTVGAAAPWAAGMTRDHTGSFAPFFLLLAFLMLVLALAALFLKTPRDKL
ncbi:MAG: hypothetical protein RL274_221 [Pseudomonadota bacterium]|jgi:cyanate permease